MVNSNKSSVFFPLVFLFWAIIFMTTLSITSYSFGNPSFAENLMRSADLSFFFLKIDWAIEKAVGELN